MRRVYVRLTPDEVEAVVQIAERERREPTDQIAYWIAEKLAERETPERNIAAPAGAAM